MAIVSHGPELMTPRARVYMLIAGMRHLALGMFCLFRPQDFTSSSYSGATNALPFVGPHLALQAYGLGFLITAVVCLFPVFNGRDGQAKAGLLLSVFFTSLWLGGFISAAIAGHLAGPSGVVIWAAVTFKDLTMLREPLRNPFEPLIQRVLNERSRG